ncbi:MAG: AsmA family protein [Candidatus Omnitrophica bacterium]|nr:AsmA family protein [Candidatus Omnitrophota bacterium]
MKKIRFIAIVFLIFVLVIIAGKDVIVKAAVTAGVKAATGLSMKIKKIKIGLVTTFIGIEELKLYNPQGFEDPIMVDIPQVYVNYRFGAFLKKEVHLEEVRLHLKEIVIAKNKDGKLNLDSLTSIKAARKTKEDVEGKKQAAQNNSKAAPPKIKIDLLKLKIDKVYYKDYSKGDSPSVKEFNVNIDAVYENITDPKALVNIIVVKALSNTTISSLMNFDLGLLAEGLKGNVKGTAGDVISGLAGNTLGIGATANDTIENTADKLNKLNPFKRRK